MWDFCTVSKPIARKEYQCEASYFITDRGDPSIFSREEVEAVKRSRDDHNRINIGDRYFKITGRDDGEFTVFRARLENHAICEKYDLYPDE